jgi:hypothetical protein
VVAPVALTPVAALVPVAAVLISVALAVFERCLIQTCAPQINDAIRAKNVSIIKRNEAAEQAVLEENQYASDSGIERAKEEEEEEIEMPSKVPASATVPLAYLAWLLHGAPATDGGRGLGAYANLINAEKDPTPGPAEGGSSLSVPGRASRTAQRGAESAERVGGKRIEKEKTKADERSQRVAAINVSAASAHFQTKAMEKANSLQEATAKATALEGIIRNPLKLFDSDEVAKARLEYKALKLPLAGGSVAEKWAMEDSIHAVEALQGRPKPVETGGAAAAADATPMGLG